MTGSAAKPTRKEIAAAAKRKKDDQNARKEAQRQREAAMGIKRVEVAFPQRTHDQVAFGCLVRGGLDEPYGLTEYLTTLIAQDYQRLQEQLQVVHGQACEQCGKVLPQGCGGDHPGYATCWFKRGPLSLEL